MAPKRLVTRLAIAMFTMTLLSLLIIAASQQVAIYQSYLQLPEEVRENVPPPSLWFARQRPAITRLQDGSVRPNVTLDESNRRIARNFESFRRLHWHTLLLGMGLAATLTLLLAIYLSRMIAAPIAKVSQAAAKVAEGDLSTRVTLSPKQERSSQETAELAQNFNSMATALETSEHERKAMIADIAHELRTPLTAMQMRLEAVKDGLLPLDTSEVEKLLDRSRLLARLVEDLRTLSLADAGKLSLYPSENNLVALAQAVLDGFQERAEHLRVSLHLSTPSGPVHAAVDRERITQVLGNLVDNALRATPEEGTITVTVAEGNDGITLQVRDAGPGIPEEDLDHIFDRFVQGKDMMGSSGLGLAIVHTLVRLHRGNIFAQNLPGGGVAFDVLLPHKSTSTLQ